MKSIKLKEPCLIPAAHGSAKHGKKGQVVEVSDELAASFISRKLADEVKPAPAPAAGKPDAPLDKAALMALNKPDLLALAVKANLAGIDEKNTKEQIADALLAAPPAK